jgi:hypothetical protein
MDIINALQWFGIIEHWTICPESSATGDALGFPPFVRWRYRSDSDSIATVLGTIIGTFQGTLAWELSSDRESLILIPARVRQYAFVNGLVGILPAAKQMKCEMPQFGKAANAELRTLALHIARHAGAMSN